MQKGACARNRFDVLFGGIARDAVRSFHFQIGMCNKKSPDLLNNPGSCIQIFVACRPVCIGAAHHGLFLDAGYVFAGAGIDLDQGSFFYK